VPIYLVWGRVVISVVTLGLKVIALACALAAHYIALIIGCRFFPVFVFTLIGDLFGVILRGIAIVTRIFENTLVPYAISNFPFFNTFAGFVGCVGFYIVLVGAVTDLTISYILYELHRFFFDTIPHLVASMVTPHQDASVFNNHTRDEEIEHYFADTLRINNDDDITLDAEVGKAKGATDGKGFAIVVVVIIGFIGYIFYKAA
jgi:hypothetical protein